MKIYLEHKLLIAFLVSSVTLFAPSSQQRIQLPSSRPETFVKIKELQNEPQELGTALESLERSLQKLKKHIADQPLKLPSPKELESPMPPAVPPREEPLAQAPPPVPPREIGAPPVVPVRERRLPAPPVPPREGVTPQPSKEIVLEAPVARPQISIKPEEFKKQASRLKKVEPKKLKTADELIREFLKKNEITQEQVDAWKRSNNWALQRELIGLGTLRKTDSPQFIILDALLKERQAAEKGLEQQQEEANGDWD